MRKIYSAFAMMLFSFTALSLSAQELGTDFITFSVPDQVTSTVNADDHTVSVTMPAGTDLTALVPEFTLSEGAIAYIGADQVTSTVTETDFTESVVYTIKNGEAKATQDWTVTVTNEVSNVNVTFNVDMGTGDNSCAGDANIYLTGGFIGWPEPGTDGSILMSDDDGDGIYSVTVEIAANTDDRYKYFVGEGWGGGDLFDGGCENGDRCLVLGTEDVTFDDVFTCVISVDKNLLEGVEAYPNPFSNSLTITNLDQAAKVTVSTLLGQQVISKDVEGDVMTIQTSELPEGIYLVNIYANNGDVATMKVVK